MSQKVTTGSGRRPTFETLAERLWWSRETAHLTQAALAARLGISKRTIQNYEHGAEAPKENRCLLWAEACDVDAEWLTGDFFRDSATRQRTGPDSLRYVATSLAA